HGGETICANKSVNGTALETSVWADVCSLLQNPERLRRELERRLQRPPAAIVDASQRKDSIAKLKRRMGRLLDAYENGWMEKDEFESRMSRAQQRLTREQQEQAQHERDVTGAQELQDVVRQFETFAAQIAPGLPAGPGNPGLRCTTLSA